ncbi:Piso0_000761 [Millerozyma farinosa CBS 7064]|uniref:Piso0_000761 protein n=1 Tax=Pichia sorbitophila (strain ATCC MYA-4447 / BCRC 22081 / CBS 7064 / NBRC 10061 / NRRL Y-12695) TaxID=559304 RepID=G8YRF8_PICSO|nr:Piso0_000761 [Millerozyma farinosa CBS 7064]
MTLDLSKVSSTYFEKLFVSKKGEQGSTRGKVLLVDKYTTPIISMCYTQSQLLQQDVILVEMIDQHRTSNVKHLDCVVYIKPTKESVSSLVRELKNAHYSKYEIYFNNSVSKSQLEQIAEADEHEVVMQVVELFQDYLIVNNHFYSIYLSGVENFVTDEASSLCSLLLSLKKCPIIKYENNSIDLKRLGSEVIYHINSNSQNNLFDDLNQNSASPPLLLLLDRKNDPITPLITPWTYQSMIHELIGINRNIVKVGTPEESLILSDASDVFFQEAMYLNYGDLTDKFQRYVEEYKKQTKSSSVENMKTQNLSELKKLLTKFPEFRKLSNNILKHLNLISELDRQVTVQNLWEVSELQQTIACNLENYSSIKTRMIELLDKPSISTENKVKLVLLYSAKFIGECKSNGDLSLFLHKLSDSSLSDPVITISQSKLIQNFNKIFNFSSSMTGDGNVNNIGRFFGGKKININLFSMSSNANNTTNNIYMQYVPKLNNIVGDIMSKTQSHSSTTFSTLIPDVVSQQYGKSIENLQDIIIYIKGGATYEECRLIHDLNASTDRFEIILGGDDVLNSKSWLNKLYDQVNDASLGSGSGISYATASDQTRDLL